MLKAHFLLNGTRIVECIEINSLSNNQNVIINVFVSVLTSKEVNSIKLLNDILKTFSYFQTDNVTEGYIFISL